jgi:CBS domain-containing protein
MYEKILTAKMHLQSLLPFIAITAAAAPLLGLLGTVTGIITTFKMITVFGSGDVKTLSGGISEALITTMFGLIVAIPSLLLHAFLSRKARSILARMEKTAISFVNQINKTPYEQNGTSKILADMPVAVAREVLRGLNRGNGGNGDVLSVRESGELSGYPEDSAGSIMNPKVITVSKTATVAEAIGKVRSADLDDDAQTIVVVDDQGKYAGDVRIHRLLTRPEQACIDALVDPDAMFVRVDTNKERLKELFDQHDLANVPVLDEKDQPVGRITVDHISGDPSEIRSNET